MRETEAQKEVERSPKLCNLKDKGRAYLSSRLMLLTKKLCCHFILMAQFAKPTGGSLAPLKSVSPWCASWQSAQAHTYMCTQHHMTHWKNWVVDLILDPSQIPSLR